MSSSPRTGRPHAPRRPAARSETGGSRDVERAASAQRTGFLKRERTRSEEQHGNADSSSSSSTRSFTTTPRRVRHARTRATTGPRQAQTREQNERRASTRERTAASPAREGRSFVVGGLEISTRLLSVLLLGSVLATFLVPRLGDWWTQEQELRDITARVHEAQERNDEMKRALELWQNPDYIASQARERLGYVKPGETQFTVVDPGEDYQDGAQVAAARAAGPARPWVQVAAILLAEADSPSESAPTHDPDARQSGESE